MGGGGLGSSNNSIHILSNFDINLLNIDTCNLTSDFLEIMLFQSPCPSIFEPTTTLIDNTFLNNNM